MSLTLIQGYSSAEEEEAEERTVEDYENSDEDYGDDPSAVRRYGSSSVFAASATLPAGDSSLPSADDVFSQVSGPPAFLNNCTDADEEASARDAEHAKRLGRKKKKKDIPKGAVMEAKPQLVGIHERVRSDIDGKPPLQSGEKRAHTATNPNLEEAADLLRYICQFYPYYC
ncbi:PREDICTED: uncharacterized protein LOC104818435 [Tarenaya hassleriana]|uniref:uncharacterized protein LOC104818435 n=1 Tax=Tarenaya hassleriana TaxID=28532 RepID=UPI00053CA1B0|nr:PREDICTED: uncharacterized protein LOC104818435 [Tarenaya hassleriana]